MLLSTCILYPQCPGIQSSNIHYQDLQTATKLSSLSTIADQGKCAAKPQTCMYISDRKRKPSPLVPTDQSIIYRYCYHPIASQRVRIPAPRCFIHQIDGLRTRSLSRYSRKWQSCSHTPTPYTPAHQSPLPSRPSPAVHQQSQSNNLLSKPKPRHSNSVPLPFPSR